MQAPMGSLIDPTWHQLLVLGNGFDLECGLASRFSDFMKERISQMDVDSYRVEYWRSLFDEMRLTAWDFILRDSTDVYWFDIEQLIAEWVVSLASKQTGRDSLSRKLLAAIKRYPFNPTMSARMPTGGTRPYDEQVDEDFCIGNVARAYLIKCGDGDASEVSIECIEVFLKNELTIFESEFANFLAEQVKGNTSYAQTANSLLEYITEDELPVEHAYNIKTSILNFNYTDPFFSTATSALESKVNIHGSLKERKIIFGIDGKDYMENGLILPFTKTYRVALLNSNLPKELVRFRPSFGAHFGTEEIKFYGHSLGDADYSYFQSIFDSVNLYGGTTKLIFYYKSSQPDGAFPNEEDTAKIDMVLSVSRLLNAYGHTLDNKDHGANLMHKLLLEGRLSIKAIPGWRQR